MERHLYSSLTDSNLKPEHQTPVGEIDKDKVWSVFKKYSFFVLIIFILCNLAAYLTIRWTKPLYQSYSDIKLDIKSDVSLLGLSSEPIYQSNLDGEIEIIRSRLFSNKVIEVLNLHTSYYNYGNVLNEERYKNSPFEVEHNIKNTNFYDKNFDLEILDEYNFKLSYSDGDKKTESTFKFGQKIENKHFSFIIHLRKNPIEKDLLDLKYFFRINSQKALVNYLESNLKVEPLNYNANIIRISFKDHNYIKAADLVNAVDTLYLKYTQEEKSKVNLQKINFLTKQLDVTEAKLDEYEHYLEDFTITNKTVDLTADLDRTITRMVAIDSARINIAIRLQKLQELEDALLSDQEIVFAATYASVFRDNQTINLFQDYNELVKRKILLSNSYSIETYALRKIDEEISLIKKEISFELNELKKNLRKQEANLASQKYKTEENFISMPSKGSDLKKIRRYYSLYEQFYLSMMQIKAEFEIAQAGTSTDFKVLSSASIGSEPISPNKILIHGIGFGTSIILIVLLLAIGYLAHNKVVSQTEIERLTNAPLIGVIPFTKHDKDFTTLIVDKRPKSALSESLRAIRTNLDFFVPKEGPKIITVTSTVSGEGKTFVAVNLGGILSFSGNKVIILDLDMRKPKVHRAFHQPPSELGLSTILIGRHKWQDSVFRSSQENLHYIQSGPIPPNPSELLMSQNFHELLEALKLEYNYIILDTPPVGVVTDGIITMKKSDLQLYVVRANYSKLTFLSNVEKLLKSNNFQRLGIILNSLNSSKNTYGYGYGDGDGSGYYVEDDQKQSWKFIFTNLFRR